MIPYEELRLIRSQLPAETVGTGWHNTTIRRLLDEVERLQGQIDGMLKYPRARKHDRETSQLAALKIRPRLTQSRRDVLLLFDWNKNLTDEELVEAYNKSQGLYPQSPSSIRSRRSELVYLGLVGDTGKRRKNKLHNSCIVWARVPQAKLNDENLPVQPS